MGQDNYPPPPDPYNQVPVYNQPPTYSYNQQPAYAAPPTYNAPVGYDTQYDNPKANNNAYYETENVNIYDAPTKKCGALGDCLGWNQPVDHENIRRNLLIRKVMLVVMVQLFIVSIECSIFYFIDSIRIYLVENGWWIVLVVLIPEIVVLIILFVLRRKSPVNLILLFLFTVTTGKKATNLSFTFSYFVENS